MSNSLITLGNNLQALLDHLDRKPAWLAKKSGVDPGTISRILSAKMNVTLKTLEGLAHALDTEPGQLLQKAGAESLAEVISAWKEGGLIFRAMALYFLTGQEGHLQIIDGELAEEAQTLRKALAQVQAALASRKRK